ncbi:WD40 repeat domain-containing protein [Streptomyces griseorubiginosus]|uniref:WD40 repeat domain-containing protein n=1 Tax=Streptomyces griseorubiginosus TaxID=67304 RepID=UPI0036386918
MVTDRDVTVWDTRSGHRLAELAEPGATWVSVSGDGRFLAAVSHDEIHVWRLVFPDAQVFRHPLDGQRPYDGGPFWDPDGRTLRYLEGGTVHTLDLGAAVTPSWRSTQPAAELLSPDGRTYATAERTGSGYVFTLRAIAGDHRTRTLVAADAPGLRDPSAPVPPGETVPLMAFGPDGKTFAYGVSAPGRDLASQPLRLWDLAHDRALSTLNLSGPSALSIALGPGGHILLAVRPEASAGLRDEVWDVAGHRRTALMNDMTSVLAAVRPDGRLFVGDGRTIAFPPRSPSRPNGFAVPTRVVRKTLVQGDGSGAMGFAANGSLFAAGDRTGRVALWDAGLEHRAAVLRNTFPAPLDDNPEGVTAVAVSPDGATLAIGGDAGSVQLWDVAIRQPLGGLLPTPGDGIASLAFSPDGSTLYAASSHVPLQIYPIGAAHALTEVCARGRGAVLTRAEWRSQVQDVPYLRVCAGTRSG